MIFVETLQKFSAKITGHIVDDNGKSLPFASVVITQPNDTAYIAGTATDNNGRFEILSNKKYVLLKASYIGYGTKMIIVSSSRQNTDIGDVILSPRSIKLKEVKITSSEVIEKADKYVILPDSQQVELAGRTINLLDGLNIPGLKVDRVLQSITVDNGTPIFKVNGKEQNMNKILNLNPKNIEKIEYSNFPGIRYLDRGSTGIINFILKKRADGGSLSSYAQAAFNTGFFNGGLEGSYNFKKSEFSLSYNNSLRDYNKWLANTTEKFISTDRSVERNQMGVNSPMYYFDNSITAQYTLMPSDNSMFNVTFINDFRPAERGNDGNVSETENGTLKKEFFRYSHSTQNYYAPSLDVYYSHGIDKTQSIELNIVGNVNDSYNHHTLKYDYSDGSQYIIEHNVDNNGWAVTAEAAYKKDFGKISTRFGTQYLHNFAKNKYLSMNEVSKMKKDNTYIYGEMNGSIGKASYNLGSGLKILYVNDYTSSKTYARNLTTASLYLPIGKKWSFRYRFNFGPILPSLSELSPVVQTVNDVEQSTGNPQLSPSEFINNRVVFRYNLKKFTMTADVSYFHYINPITSTYTFNYENSMFVSKPINGSYQDDLELNLDLGYKGLLEHINIYLDSSLDRSWSAGDGYYHTMNNFSTNLQVQFYWGQWITGCSYNLSPYKSLWGEYISWNERQANIYAQYKYRNFNFALSACNLFNKNGYKYQSRNLSNVSPSYSVNWTKNNGNMIILSVSYNINFGNRFKKAHKNLSNGGYDSGLNTVK